MLRQSRVRCPLSYFSLKVVDPPPTARSLVVSDSSLSLSPRPLHFLLSGFCKLGFLCLLLVLETWGLCHANMTSFVRSTWAVGSISGALWNGSGRLVIKPIQAAAPLRVLYLSCFFLLPRFWLLFSSNTPKYSDRTELWNGPFHLISDRNFWNFGLCGKRP